MALSQEKVDALEALGIKVNRKDVAPGVHVTADKPPLPPGFKQTEGGVIVPSTHRPALILPDGWKGD